jgi:preprotein translocase subunit SecA
MLQAIDTFWIEHLEVMDYMRGSVNLRAYGQRDPLVEYKREGLRLFKEMEAAAAGQIVRLIPTIASAPNNGIFINSENLSEELKSSTEKLGLNSFESEEFVNYWTPRLTDLNKKYIFFSILDREEKERTDHVEISPKPDTFIQFIAYFKGFDEKFDTNEFVYPEKQERKGFTAIEWGGVIDR